MKFELKVGTDHSTVRFTAGVYDTVKFKLSVIKSFENSFSKLGGVFLPEEGYVWTFPKHITSEVLQEVIHNTCFVCGGLMKDDYHEEMKESIKYNTTIRKCSSCGHSHT